MNKENYLLTIKAEERPGLLHLITGMIEKRQGEIKSLNAAPTDLHGILLVTIEIGLPDGRITALALKLENIIEVFSVEACQHQAAICLRAAYFRVARTFLDTPKVSLLQSPHTLIVSWHPDAFILAHHGNDRTVRELYHQLDGPHLLGFSQTGLISEASLKDTDAEGRVMGADPSGMDVERITRLAA